MSGGNWTPGPWHAVRGLTQMCDPDATTIARIGPVAADGASWWIFSPADDHGDAEATARLIASAPTLAARCDALERALRETRIALSFAEPALELALEMADMDESDILDEDDEEACEESACGVRACMEAGCIRAKLRACRAAQSAALAAATDSKQEQT